MLNSVLVCHRIIEKSRLKGTSRDCLVQPSGPWIRLSRVLSSQDMNTSSKVDYTTSLGQTVPVFKSAFSEVFPISRQHFPWSTLCPLPVVLSPCITVKWGQLLLYNNLLATRLLWSPELYGPQAKQMQFFQPFSNHQVPQHSDHLVDPKLDPLQFSSASLKTFQNPFTMWKCERIVSCELKKEGHLCMPILLILFDMSSSHSFSFFPIINCDNP